MTRIRILKSAHREDRYMPNNKAHKRIRLVLPIVLLILSLLACVAFLVVFLHQEAIDLPTETEHKQVSEDIPLPTETGSSSEANTTPTKLEATVSETETTYTEPPSISIHEQPEELTKLLDLNSTTYEDLAQENCSQLVVVIASGTSASIRFYSCSDGLWQEIHEMSCTGHVGRSGVLSNKREGDGGTPAGIYAIGNAFYIQDEPETALEVFQITPDTYWVDDPNSTFYNQRVEGTDNKDWSSAEHMIRYDAYQYGFVIEYNTSGKYAAGSAIFFHIGDHPTAGCISTAESMVLTYLAELDPNKQLRILITND